MTIFPPVANCFRDKKKSILCHEILFPDSALNFPEKPNILEIMQNQTIHLGGMARKLSFVPPVRAVGFFSALQLPHEQRSDGLQFCYRFHADSNWIEFDQDGRKRIGGFPQLLVKRPGEWFVTGSEVKLNVFWISFDGAQLPWFQTHGLPEELAISELELSGRMISLIRDIRELCIRSAEPGALDRIDISAQALIAETLLCIDEEHRTEGRMERQIARIVSYLKLHFNEKIDFDELARQHGFSRRNFFRHWNAAYPETPAQYVARLRQEEARRLLANTTWSIGRIAAALGYGSETYFAGTFRKAEKMAPREYRKHHFALDKP